MKYVIYAGMSCVVALVAGCSFFSDVKEQTLTIRTIPKDSTVLLDGVEHRPPISKKVSTRKDVAISVYREGYESQTVKATSTFSYLGKLDAVGCYFLLLPGLGLISDGAYELNNTHFLIELEKK